MHSVQRGRSGQLKRPTRLAGRLTLAALVAVGLGGCDSLLDVENPNNVVQQDLENPEAVTALVNGALALTSDAVGEVAVSTSGLADEYVHTGSQNYAAEIDRGIIANPSGRSDELTNTLAEAVWTAEEALRLAVEQGASNEDVMRANLYSGILHMTIADVMEDFAFSDRTTVGAPVGEANMLSVYDTAIERLEAAEALATGPTLTEVQAMLARAHWGRAMWPMMQTGSTPADPMDALINDATANSYAQTVLAAVGNTSDWEMTLEFTSNTDSSPQGSFVNSRQEFAFSGEYVVIDNSGKAVRQDSTDVDGDGDLQEADVVIMDPIDGVPDQGLQGIITEFVAAFLYPPVRVVTARELHLMLAEADIATGGDGETELNYVRALKSSDVVHTPYNAANPLHPEPIDMLRYERRVNLFNMPTLRLWDMYRFGEQSPRWGAVSDAVTTPGQVFVIGQSERVSNCYILGTC